MNDLDGDLAFDELMDFFSKDSIENIVVKDESFLSTNVADKEIVALNQEIKENLIKEPIIVKSEPIIVFEKTKAQELEELKAEGFNEQQLKVINSPYPIVNIAGPGSGKTKTLIAKITTQVREIKDLKEMLVLTFTNAASNEILDRLGKKFETKLDRKDFYSGTYHGIFYKLIRENEEKLKQFGFTGSPRILDSNEDKHLFESVVQMVLDRDSSSKKKDIKESFEDAHGFMPLEVYYQINNSINTIPTSIKDIKEQVLLMSDAKDQTNLDNLEKIVHGFFKAKIEGNLFGFSDILMYMNFLLEKDKEFKDKIQNKFKYILVDEYQDTNPIQAKILSHLEKNNNSCIIGDPYQSIYRFLGASVKNIMDKSKVEGMNTIQLTQNYRSTPNIVEFTNDIAKLFNERVQNHLPCESATKGLTNLRVSLKEGLSQEYAILNDVKYRLKKGVELKDMAVLARTKFETYKLEAGLRREKIPFIKLGGNALYETKEVRFMIDLAKVLLNDYSLQNFESVASKFKGLGASTIEKLNTAYLTKENKLDTMQDLIKKQFEKSKPLNAFSDLIFGDYSPQDKGSLFNQAKNDGSPMSFDKFVLIMEDSNINIEEVLIKAAETTNKKREIETNIKYFKEELKEYFAKGIDELKEFLNDVCLGQNELNEDELENALTISTIHGAKGKEWRDVYVLNVEEGKFPSARSNSDKNSPEEREALMEEEKRLLYVAVSRAKEKLMLTAETSFNDFVRPLVRKPYVEHYKGNR